MKLNWGWYIVFSLIGFAIFIIFMVYRMSLQNIDLITENYYNEELLYQEIIDQKQRALERGLHLNVFYDKEEVIVEFPFDQDFTAELNFLHPEKKLLDKTYTSVHKQLRISRKEFTPGKWLIKCKVACKGEKFYFEDTIFL